MKRTELSIIIPTLNEEQSLPIALESIAGQKQIELEIIVSDGGSTDRTRSVAMNCNLQRISFVNAASGKPEQLNVGAARATGEFILFLHADSSFQDDLALRKGVDCLRKAEELAGGRGFAGHFRLKFKRNSSVPSLGYTFYERKASLHRPGCSHGDQGIMLSREMFAETGSFSTSCPMLAETRFADQLREKGQWLLMPADILTSARRFEKEGLKERQTLNAMIMALGWVGMDQVINGIPNIYRDHSLSESLEIYPMLAHVRDEISALSRDERRSFWLKIGEYVSNNAWQIPFYLDVRRGFRADGVVGDNSLYWLNGFDHFFRLLICNKPGAFCAGIIVRIWFKLLLLRLGNRC